MQLKEILKQKKMTGYRLAQLMGISTQTVDNWVKGKNKPSLKYAFKICEVLEISRDCLIDN